MFEEKTEEAGPVLDSLNILSSYGWKINQPVSSEYLQLTPVRFTKRKDMLA
jgi:hypothetical protein